jgi:hypothetical protein
MDAWQYEIDQAIAMAMLARQPISDGATLVFEG